MPVLYIFVKFVKKAQVSPGIEQMPASDLADLTAMFTAFYEVIHERGFCKLRAALETR
jgi:hypothetical protein